MPPTTVRLDAIRPVELCVPTTISADCSIDTFFDRTFTGRPVVIDLYSQVEVVRGMRDVLTSYLVLVEVIQTMLQGCKGRVENGSRGTTRTTKIDMSLDAFDEFTYLGDAGNSFRRRKSWA